MKPRAKLLEDARAAGYAIEDAHGSVCITKSIGRWSNRVGLLLFPDGTAYRVDIDLSVAKALRSYREMRQHLGLDF